MMPWTVRAMPRVCAALSVLAVASLSCWPAGADDLNPATFRGEAGTTRQAWNFNNSALGAPDSDCPPASNPFGPATVSAGGPTVWLPEFDHMKGIQCLPVGSSLNFAVPDANAPALKTVWIQVTFHRHAGTDVRIDTVPPALQCSPPIDLRVPGKGPDWIHRTVACCLPICPAVEVVTLTAIGPPTGHLDIGQVVIETACKPDSCEEPHPPVAPNDYDGDGWPDDCDNAPGVFNPNQQDCDHDLLGDVSDLCDFCPPGTPVEPEPCGANLNGGCSSLPPAVTGLSCNSDICGTTWADGGVRDTDWYEVFVPDADGDGKAEITLELCTTFPAQLFLVNIDCTNIVFYATADAEADRATHVTACLPAPSKYRVVVAPGSIAGGGIFTGIPCSSNAQYWLKVFCAEPCQVCGAPGAGDCCQSHGGPGCNDAGCCALVCAVDPSCCQNQWDAHCASAAGTLCHARCCRWDLNQDGIVDGADLGLLLGSWGPNGAADLNNDWIVDGADLGLLLGHWGPC